MQGSPGFVTKVYPYPGYCATVLQNVTEVPDEGMGILQNFQKFRVRVRKSYELPEVLGIVARAYRTPQKFRAGTKHAVPVSRVLWPRAYRISRSSGYGYECRTKLPEVPGTGYECSTKLTEVICRLTPRGK